MLKPEIWLILGIVLVALEVAAPGVGMLFTGLGAISLGGLLTFDMLHTNSLPEQVAYFFAFTGIWFVILWKPLKKLTRNKKGKTYNNLSDAAGTVDDTNDLVAGKIGHVKWSGTRMRARIDPKSSTAIIKNGETVWVHAQQDGILLVDVTKPQQDEQR